MRVNIEKYKGFDIEFDTSSEEFLAYSNYFDSEWRNSKLSNLKLKLDTYLKDNVNFKPFFVENKTDGKILKIIGIRKDNRFIYEDENKKKQQLSDYDLPKYILRNEDNDYIREQIEKLNERMEELKTNRDKLLSEISGVELKEYKKQFENK